LRLGFRHRGQLATFATVVVTNPALFLVEIFPFLRVSPQRPRNGSRGKDDQGQAGEQFYSVFHDGTSHVWLLRLQHLFNFSEYYAFNMHAISHIPKNPRNQGPNTLGPTTRGSPCETIRCTHKGDRRRRISSKEPFGDEMIK
jgi:hypothetical protein